jgi:hypothetical protein
MFIMEEDNNEISIHDLWLQARQGNGVLIARFDTPYKLFTGRYYLFPEDQREHHSCNNTRAPDAIVFRMLNYSVGVAVSFFIHIEPSRIRLRRWGKDQAIFDDNTYAILDLWIEV